MNIITKYADLTTLSDFGADDFCLPTQLNPLKKHTQF